MCMCVYKVDSYKKWEQSITIFFKMSSMKDIYLEIIVWSSSNFIKHWLMWSQLIILTDMQVFSKSQKTLPYILHTFKIIFLINSLELQSSNMEK